MAFPNNITRTLELNHAPSKVWAALTTADGLAAWFGQRATIDLRPGGTAALGWDTGEEAALRIEHLQEPSYFAYTWPINGLEKDDPRRTYVEFTLEPIPAGTRLTLVEAGFAQLLDDEYTKAFEGNTEGWTHELGELVAYLDGTTTHATK